MLGTMAKAAAGQIAKKAIKKATSVAARKMAKNIATKAAKGAAAVGGTYLTTKALQKLTH